MLTDSRIREIARAAGFGGISDSDVELCCAIEAEATAELRAEVEQLRGLLREARTRVDCIDYCMDEYQERPFWDRVDAALAGERHAE